VSLKFLDFENEVRAALEAACKRMEYSGAEIDISLPPNDEYGDLASSIPIRMSKGTSKKPGELAVKLGSEVERQLKGSRYVGKVSPHRGGYLNFSINYPRFIKDTIEAVASGDLGGRKQIGRRMIIEHTNVNPNKALHVGHARNLVLGDSLTKVMTYLGNQVQILNYIDDSGAQVADVIVGFLYLGLPQEPPSGVKYDAYCGDSVYTKVTQEYTRNPALKEKQSIILKEIEKGEGKTSEFTTSIVRRILAAQLETCWRLGASYDLLNWESHLVHSGLWEQIFESLKKRQYVRLVTEGENKGCWVIPDPDTGEEKVVVRSDGTTVYVAKDIPYAAWKIGLVKDPFGYELYSEKQPDGRKLYSTALHKKPHGPSFGAAELAVSVIDTRQSYLQRIVSKVLEKLEPGASKRYLHRAYEVVALSKKTAGQLGFNIGGEFVHMSGRKGMYVNTDSVLGALKERAKEETLKRNPKETPEWVDDVAEAVAVSALRYELVKQDPDKIIVFDSDEALRFEGDTGPYLLYTYARARRILEKTQGKPTIDLKSAEKLSKPQEIRLAKKLSMLDLAVAKAGEYLSPKEVAKFAHELAVSFNDFYEGVPVNSEPDESTRNARLALVDAGSRVLAEAMDLIGIPHRSRI
jgi:arginyl-tRNA synthetase